ncbi:proteoglycan 4-like [Asterias rubens]|uniref:proteoglycan 4-like n=1 Tax=Asterias rubens TaxID=7604 RepID=UPI00145586E3|nr:proteoglycan 4-like [Asterias rubens]
MLDPTLPWLAVGYKNFKQEDFCQRQIKDEMSKYRIDTTTDVLRSTTPQGQQRRRVKSATHARFIPRCGSNWPAYTSSPARPNSAQSYHHKTTFTDQIAERAPSRQRRPRSAFVTHKPSLAQNRSISMVEREHHEEKMIRLFVDDRDKKCAFCPVECRPKSSSSNRPTSSTGLVAAQLPTHYDRYVYSTRPRTAPATRREFLQLPRKNNIRRGQVPHYTNFVKRVELGVKDGSPSPPPRRRIAFEDEPIKPRSPTPVESSHGDVEEEEMVPFVGNEEEEEFDDVSIHIPSPTDHLLVPESIQSEEPSTDEIQEAWTEPKAPTPSPAISGRSSPVPIVDETPEQPSPPPREPTPPPREPTPPPREPTPPPREPTPPPREPTPPPRVPTPPPRDPTPPPREPTPPPEPKPKKEVRILETPILPPAKPKTVPQPTPKSCLVKKTEVPKEPEPKLEPQVVPTPEVTPVEEEKPEEVEVAVEEIEEEPQENDKSKEEKQPVETRKPDKKKLGPAPKFKVDLFSMDSGAMKNILDMEMKLRRKGGDTKTSDGDSFADIPEYLLKRRPPWQTGRMALSRRACRFEIPMDVFVLENMSPTEYLQQYCIVSKRRQAMYRRSFSKVDKDNDMKINMKEFNAAVLEALVGTVQLEQVQDVLTMIQADKFPHFGPKLFCAICSLLERLHYREFVTEDTVDKEGLVEKEKVEDADFLALDWKFDGCVINEPLKRLLYML